MDRADAIRRVKALRQMTQARGATANEEQVAAAAAARLEARFGLGHVDTQPPPPPRRRSARPAPAAGFTGWSPPASVPDWRWNPVTQEHSSNVEIKSYRDRFNWRIEIAR